MLSAMGHVRPARGGVSKCQGRERGGGGRTAEEDDGRDDADAEPDPSVRANGIRSHSFVMRWPAGAEHKEEVRVGKSGQGSVSGERMEGGIEGGTYALTIRSATVEREPGSISISARGPTSFDIVREASVGEVRQSPRGMRERMCWSVVNGMGARAL